MARKLALGDVTVRFHPAGHVLGSAQIAVACKDTCIVASRRLQGRRRSDLRAVRSWCHATCSSPRRPSACRCSATAMPADEITKLLALGRAVPGARASGRRLFARQGATRDRAASPGRLRRADLSARRDGKITRYYESRGIALGELRAGQGMQEGRSRRHHHAGAAVGHRQDVWTRRFPDPVTAFASGWMRVRARARQRGVELPLVISDHADWDGLTATIDATGAGEIWVTHGQEDALVHWCTTRGLTARPLDLVGYGDEDESEARARRRGRRGMNRFAELLDRLAYEPGRNNKLRLIDRPIFAKYARSRSRLRAGGADRRAVVQARQARADPRPDRRAHRSGAVRAVVRLRRRSLRDGCADVAEAFTSSRLRGGPEWGQQSAVPSETPPRDRPQRKRCRPSDLSRHSGAVRRYATHRTHNNAAPYPHRSRHHAAHARQDRTAEAARPLARRARRDRPLGAVETGHRRDADRRSRRGWRRPPPRRSATRTPHDVELMWPGLDAALSRAVRLAGRPRRQAGQSAIRRRSAR